MNDTLLMKIYKPFQYLLINEGFSATVSIWMTPKFRMVHKGIIMTNFYNDMNVSFHPQTSYTLKPYFSGAYEVSKNKK